MTLRNFEMRFKQRIGVVGSALVVLVVAVVVVGLLVRTYSQQRAAIEDLGVALHDTEAGKAWAEYELKSAAGRCEQSTKATAAKLASCQQRLMQCERAVLQLKQGSQENQAGHEALQRQARQEGAEHETAQSEVEKAKELQVLQGQLVQCQLERGQLEQERDLARQHAATADQQLQECRLTSTSLQQELAQAKARLSERTRELDSMRYNLQLLQQEWESALAGQRLKKQSQEQERSHGSSNRDGGDKQAAHAAVQAQQAAEAKLSTCKAKLAGVAGSLSTALDGWETCKSTVASLQSSLDQNKGLIARAFVCVCLCVCVCMLFVFACCVCLGVYVCVHEQVCVRAWLVPCLASLPVVDVILFLCFSCAGGRNWCG